MLLAKETKWTSLEVITDPIFLESLISKYGFGPVKLQGLSRNGPLVLVDFQVRLGHYHVCNLHDKQVKFLGKIFEEILTTKVW